MWIRGSRVRIPSFTLLENMGDRCLPGVLIVKMSSSVVWAVAGNPENEEGEMQ